MCTGRKYEMETDLISIKNQLAASLGDKWTIYLSKLKLWFKTKLSKEEYDLEARKLLTPNSIQLHNKLLLAILNKCSNFTTSVNYNRESNTTTNMKVTDPLPPTGMNPSKTRYFLNFKPVDPVLHAPVSILKEIKSEEKIRFASCSLLLPDLAMIHGRMLVRAWEIGLDGVEDQAISYLAIALELKNILTALISLRKPYKTREKKFVYSFGVQPPNSLLNNSHRSPTVSHFLYSDDDTDPQKSFSTIRPTYESAEQYAAFKIACSNNSETITQEAASLFDLYECLKVHRNAIGSHTVYCLNMERIVSLLHQENVN